MSEEAAWAAGFFDGEGTISIRLGTQGQWIRTVSTENNVREALVALDQRTGGRGTIYPPRAGWRTWRWEVHGADKQQAAIEAMFPFLLVKRRHAQLALDFLDTVGRSGQLLPSDIIQQREAIAAELKVLNRRIPRSKER
jgi:hypothetical protein